MGSWFSRSTPREPEREDGRRDQNQGEDPFHVFLEAVNRYDRLDKVTGTAIIFEVFARSNLGHTVATQLQSAMVNFTAMLREMPVELLVPVADHRSCALVSRPFHHDIESGECEPCPICLDALEEGQTVLDIPCGHLFHEHCLRTWMNRASACPLCRQPFV